MTPEQRRALLAVQYGSANHVHADVLEALAEQQLVVIDGDRVRITDAGLEVVRVGMRVVREQADATSDRELTEWSVRR